MSLGSKLRQILFLLIFLLASFSSQAQELPPPDIDDTVVKTSEPTETSEASDVSEMLPSDEKPDPELEVQDEDLFGEDAVSDTDEEPTETHVLKFEFNENVVFFRQEKQESGEVTTGEPYLEVSYELRFETPIELSNRKRTKEIEFEITANQWGSLAKNEFFDCRLEIEIPKIAVEIATKIQEETSEDDVVKQGLILKIALDSQVREDWFSLCTDFSGTNLNTQGDTEDYYAQILKLVDPPLKSILVEELDPSQDIVIPLNAPQKIIDDRDIDSEIQLNGQGQITIEPL